MSPYNSHRRRIFLLKKYFLDKTKSHQSLEELLFEKYTKISPGLFKNFKNTKSHFKYPRLVSGPFWDSQKSYLQSTGCLFLNVWSNFTIERFFGLINVFRLLYLKIKIIILNNFLNLNPRLFRFSIDFRSFSIPGNEPLIMKSV